MKIWDSVYILIKALPRKVSQDSNFTQKADLFCSELYILIVLQDSPFRHHIHVLYNVNQDGGDIFEEMNADILFYIKLLTVDKLSRKHGLARELLRRSVDLAKCLGFKGIKAEATGKFKFIFSCKKHSFYGKNLRV